LWSCAVARGRGKRAMFFFIISYEIIPS
jgi:hypothetical protein